MDGLEFAWIVCAHVKSNAIVLTNRVAVGRHRRRPDEPRRRREGRDHEVDPARRRHFAASDAFFPFRDGLDLLADAGITAIIQPGGSVRDAEVIAAANERGVAMVFTGERHFRH